MPALACWGTACWAAAGSSCSAWDTWRTAPTLPMLLMIDSSTAGMTTKKMSPSPPIGIQKSFDCQSWRRSVRITVIIRWIVHDGVPLCWSSARWLISGKYTPSPPASPRRSRRMAK